MSHVTVGKKRWSRRKENALIITFRHRCALLHISDENVFQFSLVHNFVLRTNANFISLSPFLPSSLPVRRCLRKNQLYPAISIGLHAKMSTLYCCHCHIIRDISTSHFPVGGCGIVRSRWPRPRSRSNGKSVRMLARYHSFYMLRIPWSERFA